MVMTIKPRTIAHASEAEINKRQSKARSQIPSKPDNHSLIAADTDFVPDHRPCCLGAATLDRTQQRSK